jgi:pimeloyl-ACP methyl ester carboxylesterase
MVIYINGMKAYYEAAGEGTPVVLLHGWGADSSSLRAVLKLVRDNLPSRAVAPDFPGFGFSDLPPQAWDVDAYTTWLEEFLAGLGLEQIDLIGHSFGGRVAIKFAVRHPDKVRRLVLVDSAGILPKRGFSYHFKVRVAKTLKFCLQHAPALSKFLRLDRLAASRGSQDYQKAGPLRQTLVKVVNEDLTGLLPKIQPQTLLIWGERDEETPLSDGQLMQRLIPSARLVVIPAAGHFSFVERFQPFSQALIPFLKGDPTS